MALPLPPQGTPAPPQGRPSPQAPPIAPTEQEGTPDKSAVTQRVTQLLTSAKQLADSSGVDFKKILTKMLTSVSE